MKEVSLGSTNLLRDGIVEIGASLVFCPSFGISLFHHKLVSGTRFNN